MHFDFGFFTTQKWIIDILFSRQSCHCEGRGITLEIPQSESLIFVDIRV